MVAFESQPRTFELSIRYATKFIRYVTSRPFTIPSDSSAMRDSVKNAISVPYHYFVLCSVSSCKQFLLWRELHRTYQQYDGVCLCVLFCIFFLHLTIGYGCYSKYSCVSSADGECDTKIFYKEHVVLLDVGAT